MRRAAVAFAAAAVPAVLLALATDARAQTTIGGKTYRKLATREATAQAVRAQLVGADVEWGPWQWLGPFPLPGGSKAIATVVDVAEGRALAGAFEAGRWHAVDGSAAQGGADGFGALELNTILQLPSSKHVVAYLHRTLTARSPSKLRVKIGSDDGVRLWLDGAMQVDDPSEHGFEPEQHVLTWHLATGPHEIVAKVAQDEGGWSFALAPVIEFDRTAEAALDWMLQIDFAEGESKHWRIATLPVPAELAVEVGGLDLLPDGRPIVCTRRGDVFVLSGTYVLPPAECPLTKFASGLHESLGVAVRPDARARSGWCAMVVQRGELTRLVDLDGDLHADLYETACDAWQVSGNYHEYAFGPRYDPDGNAWVTLNLGHTNGDTVMGAIVPTRGCAVRIAPDGRMEVMADGLRSPDGVNWLPGLGAAYTDNQGDYVATNKLSLLLPGSFHGHQSTLPMRAQERGEFALTSWKKGDAAPPHQEPAIWFPYSKMGQSASDFVVDDTGGKFGPFAGQLFVGDQTHATVMRVALEPVTGADGTTIQGACFPFREGFKSGVHRLRFAPEGSLFVGLTDRGWGSRGGWRDGLERVVFTGVMPFELLAIHAAPDGFDVDFTQDVDPATATAPASWLVTSWTYEYHPAYGSAEMDTAAQQITAAQLTSPRRVHLTIDHLRPGFVHELTAPGVRNTSGVTLLHDVGYYTLNRIPVQRAAKQ